MSIWSSIKGFVRAFRTRKGLNPNLAASDSLAKTIEDSTHVRGGGGAGGVGLSRASTEQQHEIVAEGHENYTKSFEEDG